VTRRRPRSAALCGPLAAAPAGPRAAGVLLRGCCAAARWAAIYTLGGVLVRSSWPAAVYQRDDLACIPILCCLLTVLLTHAAIIIIAAAATAANVENCWLW
jgi:hypothetical protein